MPARLSTAVQSLRHAVARGSLPHRKARASLPHDKDRYRIAVHTPYWCGMHDTPCSCMPEHCCAVAAARGCEGQPPAPAGRVGLAAALIGQFRDRGSWQKRWGCLCTNSSAAHGADGPAAWCAAACVCDTAAPPQVAVPSCGARGMVRRAAVSWLARIGGCWWDSRAVASLIGRNAAHSGLLHGRSPPANQKIACQP